MLKRSLIFLFYSLAIVCLIYNIKLTTEIFALRHSTEENSALKSTLYEIQGQNLELRREQEKVIQSLRNQLQALQEHQS